MKDPLVLYYLHQEGRGSNSGIGPIYSVPTFVRRGHGIGSFLSGLFRMVRLVLWSGVKAVGRETLRTGGKSLSDLPKIRTVMSSPGTSSRDMSAIRHKIVFRNYEVRGVNAPPRYIRGAAP